MHLLLRDVQPAEGVADDLLLRGVRVPQSRVLGPEPADKVGLPQFFELGLHAGVLHERIHRRPLTEGYSNERVLSIS